MSWSRRGSGNLTFSTRMHRHREPSLIQIYTDMSFLLRTIKPLYLLGFCTVLVTAVSADESKTTPLLTGLSATTISGYVTSSGAAKDVSGNYLAREGSEFYVLGNQPGDQVHPNVVLTPNGG